MAITTPDAVPGEVIEAAWGDAVRADLTALDNGKLSKTGGTMSGAINMGGAKITVLGDATADGDAISRLFADNRFVNAAGDIMLGDLYLGTTLTADPFTGAGVRFQREGALLASRTGSGGAAFTDPNMFLGRGGAAAGATAIYISFRGTPGSSATPMSNPIGSITSPTTTTIAYNTTSDERLKTAVRMADPTEALAKVGAMTPRVFTWNSDPDAGEQIGFFAQELAPVAPEAVAVGYGDPGDEPDPATGSGGFTPWMTDLSKLVPTLVAAIQALTDRIAALEATPA